MALTEDILRKKFGYNDSNFIRSILSGGEPELAARLERESQPAPASAPAPAQSVDMFQKARDAEIADFTGRLHGVPEELEAVRQGMGIPGAFQTYGDIGDVLTQETQKYQEMPEAIKQATQGKDVSARQLERMIGSRQSEALPELTEIGQQYEAAGGKLSLLLSEFTNRVQAELAPYEMEAGLLGTNITQKYDLFKQQISNDLSLELERLATERAITLQDMQNAISLAELEQASENVTFQDLGNKIGIFDRQGNLLGSQIKGLAPTRDGNNKITDPYLYASPAYSPTGGAGTVSGNWYYTGNKWIPIQ